jgi:hypothetical protein
VKQCQECKEWKAIGEFKKETGRKCKDCQSKRQKEYYQRNKEQLNKYALEYWHQNRERQLELKREYRQRNREGILEYKREYYQRNRDDLLESKREYRRRGGGHNRAQGAPGRDFKRRRRLWEECIVKAGEVCQRCNKRKPIMTFHHVDPMLKIKNGAAAVTSHDFAELDKCALLCIECHFLYTAQVWQGTWRKRDGLGYELIEWWHTSKYSGEHDEVLLDNRYRSPPP